MKAPVPILEQNFSSFSSSTPSPFSASSSSSGADGGAEETPLWVGAVALTVAAFCFGTLHVPIRRFHTANDGFFVQWAMSVGILVMGFCVNFMVGWPPVRPLAVCGGILWTIANSLTQYVISVLGLAVAMLLWNTTNSLTGWTVGRFGLFGLRQHIPPHQMINILGMLLGISGGFSFVFLRKTPNRFVLAAARKRRRGSDESSNDDEGEKAHRKGSFAGSRTTLTFETIGPPRSPSSCFGGSLCGDDDSPPPFPGVSEEHTPEGVHSGQRPLGGEEKGGKVNDENSMEKGEKKREPREWLMRFFRIKTLPAAQKMAAILLALVAGFFYNVTVVPVIYMQENPGLFPDASRSGLPYIFSHYMGVFLGSTAIFVAYALINGNTPFVDPSTILPSMAGGCLWGGGMSMLFVANDVLTQTITYPIVTTVPGVVATFWSICYFREISLTSRTNCRVLGVALSLIFVGASLVFISKLPWSLKSLEPSPSSPEARSSFSPLVAWIQ